MEIEKIAKVCHNVNLAYCLSLGDTSQRRWEDTPDWQRSSAVDGVKSQLTHDSSPDSSHNDWRRRKEADGWKYGPEKNPEKKEHPCMVSFEKLPVEQQAKSFIFSAIVGQLKDL